MIRSRLITLSFALAAVPAFAWTSPTVAHVQTKGGQKEQPDGSCKCPVTGILIAKGKGVLVKAKKQSYRVVDEAAAKELEARPDQYLTEDGTPRNQ